MILEIIENKKAITRFELVRILNNTLDNPSNVSNSVCINIKLLENLGLIYRKKS